MAQLSGFTPVAALHGSKIRKFASDLSGGLILPTDAAYESARRVWNWAVDLHPGLIVRCANRQDVVQAVEFARGNDLLVAVRAGGHSYAGHSTCEGGMVIDLSPMKSIRIDSAKRIAFAQAGLTTGELDAQTQAFKLATSMGACSATGIAGVTLGGGFAWLAAKYGASCDNVLEADLVSADGAIKHADPHENADLFWAIRGGGGNFGIVTNFSYRLHPITQAWGGMRAYSLARGRDVLRFYRDFTAAAADEITSQIATMPLADEPAIAIMICYAGDLADGERVLAPLRRFGEPLLDSIRPMRFLEVQAGQADVPAMEQCCFHQRSGFLRELTDDAIDLIIDQLTAAPSSLCGTSIWHHHGAICRVGASEMAFSFRQPGYYIWTQTFWQSDVARESSIDWVNRSWEALRPAFASSLYVNQLGDEGEERVRAAYGCNFERLVALKNKYDPTNLFRLNQNIKPAV